MASSGFVGEASRDVHPMMRICKSSLRVTRGEETPTKEYSEEEGERAP